MLAKNILIFIHSTNKNYLVKVDINNLVKCECDFTINFCYHVAIHYLFIYRDKENFDTIIHIDCTFKLNVENYLLYVILVQDSNWNGRPVP